MSLRRLSPFAEMMSALAYFTPKVEETLTVAKDCGFNYVWRLIDLGLWVRIWAYQVAEPKSFVHSPGRFWPYASHCAKLY